MEAESSGRPQSFEDATLALIQALSPGHQVGKELLPFKQLRKVFGDFVSKGHQHSSTSTGGESPATASENSKFFGVEERNGCSNLELSDDSSSQVSLDDSSVSRSRSLMRAKNLDRLAFKKSAYKLPKYSRKMAHIRLRRREAMRIKEFIAFDCTESELADRFWSVCRDQLLLRSNSVEVFHIALNSLENYFHHKTWLENVEDLGRDFLERHILKKFADLVSNDNFDSKDVNNENRLREYELMVLFELYLLQHGKQNCDVADTDIIGKMQFLYINGGTERMRKFLDEPIADLFAHVLPKVLVQMYEELCITLPNDLGEYANLKGVPQEIDTSWKSTPVINRKMSKMENIDRLLKEEVSEAEDEPSTSRASLPPTSSRRAKLRHLLKAKRPRQLRRSLFTSEDGGLSERKKDSAQLDNRKFMVPETPEASVKKRKRGYPSENDDHKKTIMQTPMAKMNKASVSSRRSVKYSLLLRKNGSRTALNGSMELASSTSPKRRFSTRRQARDFFLPSPGQTSSLSQGSSRSNTVRKMSLSFNDRLAECARQRSSDNLNVSSQSQQETAKDEFLLDKIIVDKYRKRMESVRHSQRKADKNEVFYGRSAKRSNLFEDNPADETASGVMTRSSACLTVQKNRSGRSVDCSRVHLAHALLNVHNNEPLNPSKAPKTSPFKLNRMVRVATKSDLKKLHKLKIRMQRDRGTCNIVSSPDASPITDKPFSSPSPVEV